MKKIRCNPPARRGNGRPKILLSDAERNDFIRHLEQCLTVEQIRMSKAGDPASTSWSLQGQRLLNHFKRWHGHGENCDRQSACANLVHVAAVAVVLWHMQKNQQGTDDRPATLANRLLAEL